MSMTLKLDEDGDGTYEREYELKAVQSRKNRRNLPGVATNVAGKDVTDARIISIQGKTGSYTIEFDIYDDGTDRSNGTAASTALGDFTDDTVETLQEQEEWLNDYMQSGTIGASWKLEGTGFPSGGIDVHLEDVEIDMVADSPTSRIARLQLKIGAVVSL